MSSQSILGFVYLRAVIAFQYDGVRLVAGAWLWVRVCVLVDGVEGHFCHHLSELWSDYEAFITRWWRWCVWAGSVKEADQWHD